MISEATILNLEATRNDALLEGDRDALDAIFAEDCAWIHSSGRADDKATLLDMVSSGQIHFRSIRPTEMKVRVRPRAAVAGGLVDVEAEISGTIRTMLNRFCVLWVLEEDVWRVLHWQSTAVASH